jgi:hypothetical protein
VLQIEIYLDEADNSIKEIKWLSQLILHLPILLHQGLKILLIKQSKGNFQKIFKTTLQMSQKPLLTLLVV